MDEKIKQTSGVVLFDFTHANQYQTPEVQSLKEAIEKRGGQVRVNYRHHLAGEQVEVCQRVCRHFSNRSHSPQMNCALRKIT